MKKIYLSLLACLACFCACDDSTSLIGVDIMPDGDNVTAKTGIYNVPSITVKVDSVLANTSTCYLGSIIDPELRIRTTCDFLAQFHLPENFKLPDEDNIYKNEKGEIVADSCDIRIYFDEYVGDSLSPMNLQVCELDKNRVMEEDTHYYTNIDPEKYVSADPQYKKDLSYTVKDLTRPDNETSGSTYYRQVAVKLPETFGTELLNAYYSHPEYFTDSYQFIHRVCPGFFFRNTGGTGVMLASSMMGMNVYFRYHTKNASGNDTIVDGMQRFGATQEVIQSTKVENEYPGDLTVEHINRLPGTFLKTPSGFFTEMTLPVGEIVAGEHYNDSINQAQISIRKYNSSADAGTQLDIPQYLLMLKKSELNSFFEKKGLPDNASSYLSSQYSSSVNAYQFSNISQLITNLKHERDSGAGVQKNDDEQTRSAKYAAWEEKHPDWNKVMVIPVAVKYTTTTNYYGQVTRVLQSVRHNLGLTSVRLEGGAEAPLQISVVYSRINR